jgi:site-specific recombinase XerD
MKSISSARSSELSSINYRDDFAQFLVESERSAYTIKNYLCDLDSFSQWLKSKSNNELTPALITPTDLREYKQYLNETLLLKPQTINRRLSSLRSFLNWAVHCDHLPDRRLPHFPQPVKEQASSPQWLDRLQQHALCRIVEKGKLKQ